MATAMVLGPLLRNMPVRQALSSSARSVGATFRAVRPFPPAPAVSGFSTSAAASKVAKILQGEEKHEREEYKQSKDIAAFLKSSQFKLVDTPGDVSMALEKQAGGRSVRIEWQLTPPFNPDEESEEPGAEPMDSTEVVVTVEDTERQTGLTFYCSTQAGEDHRYIIGNVKSFSLDDKDKDTSYTGPDFEDLDDKLQEAFDEYLAEVGMSAEVCDFIDAMATDKEQREYMRWLENTRKFLQAEVPGNSFSAPRACRMPPVPASPPTPASAGPVVVAV
eukprot:CAMPEP_0179271792 /NCGR_PEP_ID=MMETSP0797-20121207/32164_1 /TAXON_ID=47934 /ORGANISM="Dinophysis acuminata, Strain DAEP01" /LENGTH=275 /DNA_ID=CAMNT_0020980167 /DNA_START=64 /DNA_END=889 /DNA_ORIENTATION=-